MAKEKNGSKQKKQSGDVSTFSETICVDPLQKRGKWKYNSGTFGEWGTTTVYSRLFFTEFENREL